MEAAGQVGHRRVGVEEARFAGRHERSVGGGDLEATVGAVVRHALAHGVQRPTASWGTMLSDGRDYIRNYPHISMAPGIAITLTVLAFNLIGDGLRDALDPRQRD